MGGLYYHVDEDEAVRTLRRAVELGASYVDTAPLYGHGRSERIVGKALSALPRSATSSSPPRSGASWSL